MRGRTPKARPLTSAPVATGPGHFSLKSAEIVDMSWAVIVTL